MGIKEKDKLSKHLDDPESLPEVTNEEVFQMLSDMQASASSMFEDAVREVFEFLRIYGREDRLKTNQKSRFAIGKKVILHGVVRYWTGRLSIEYGYKTRDKIASVDRIFHVLDGSKVDTGYISELVDAINTTEDGTGETQYFRFRACKNGNLHLEFKRPDLVHQL